MPSSPFIGLVAVPLLLVGVSFYLVRGAGLMSPSIPYEVLQFPPSPTHAKCWLRWTVAPRDILLGIDLERLALAYAWSGPIIFVLNALSPNWNRPQRARPGEPKVDPRKEKSVPYKPGQLVRGAVALHIMAMRVLALRTAPGYAAVVDARAGMKKQTGPAFQDVGAVMGGVLGVLLGFRELGNVADRFGEFISVKAHRNLGQLGQLVSGAVRLFFVLALFRRSVVPAAKPVL